MVLDEYPPKSANTSEYFKKANASMCIPANSPSFTALNFNGDLFRYKY